MTVGTTEVFVKESIWQRVKSRVHIWTMDYENWLRQRRYRRIRRLLKRAVPDSGMVAYAESELGSPDGKDGPDIWMHEHLLDMVRLFSLEGHSGSSPPMASAMLKRLLDWKPLGPLTGEPDEWLDRDHMDGNTLQNRRRSSVFKHIDTGDVYDIYGYVFREPEGFQYTSSQFSSRKVTFPYVPSDPVVVDVPKDATDEQMREAMKKAGISADDIHGMDNG